MSKHRKSSSNTTRPQTAADSEFATSRGVRGDVGEALVADETITIDDSPPPQELTGRAATTDEDLVSLMANSSPQHLRDGFQSGSGEDPATDVQPGDGEEEEDTPDRGPL